MKWHEYFTPWILVPFLLVLFFVVAVILRFSAGVRWRLDFDPGPLLRHSRLGSGKINGVHVAAQGLQIVEHPQGWTICMLPTWFFGVLWLPKNETVISPLQPATWLLPQWRMLNCGEDSVVLYGHLADFVSTLPEGKMKSDS